jgi:hypothetical protein
VLINGQPLSTFDLEPVSSDGRVSFASGSLVITELSNTAGVQLTQKEFDRPRRVTVRCRIKGQTVSSFFANRDSVADALRGALEVKFTDVDDLADRILYCQFERMGQPGGPGPEWLTPNREFELVLVATNPFFHDELAGITGGNTVPAEIPVGTATTLLVTEVHGAISEPITLTFKDFRGNTVAALKYDGAIAAGEWLEIRHDLRMVRLFTGVGASTNERGNLDATVTDHNFFFPSPDIASRAIPAYPTVEVTAGTAVSILNKFRRAWN